LCKVEKLTIVLASVHLHRQFTVHSFLLSYVSSQAVNNTGISHDFLRFKVLKSPEKGLTFASVI